MRLPGADPISIEREREREHERTNKRHSVYQLTNTEGKTMKLSSASIALALAAGSASAQDNADTAAILANWGFGSAVESSSGGNEPQNAAPPPPLAQPVVPPPAEAEQPAAGSTLDSVIAMWGFGSSEPEEAPQPPPQQQPAVQAPAGGSTLDAVLANWDAMNNFGSGSPNQPQQTQTIGDMINNNAAGGGYNPPPTNLPAGGTGGPITNLPASSGGSLGLWGHGPDVPMDEVQYPGDMDDGWNGHGDGHIQGEGWGGNTGGAPGPLPKPVMPEKLNKKQMKRWCRKNDVPMKDCEEGYGHVKYEEDKKTDIHYILDNFHEGEMHPWTHPGDGGMMGGGDKMDKQEELDSILDKFYGEKYLPHHEPKHQQDYIDSIAAKLKMAKEAKMKHPDMKPGMPTTLLEMGQNPYPGLPADSWGPECIDRALEAEKAGAKGRECMGRDEAICRDDWSFGIAPSTVGNSTDYYVQAWHEKEGTDWPLFRDFEGAIELCIGSSKEHDDTSYMTVTTEEATYYLVCPGVGKSDKNPKLKITDGDTIDIVNFQRGLGDDEVMWQITGEGMDMTNPWCQWEVVPHDAAKPMMPPMPEWMPPAP